MLLPKIGLRYIFGLMFRPETSILLIHYPCSKIHCWHVVNQSLSYGSVSDHQVVKFVVKELIQLGGLGHVPHKKIAKLKHFLVRTPRYLAGT